MLKFVICIHAGNPKYRGFQKYANSASIVNILPAGRSVWDNFSRINGACLCSFTQAQVRMHLRKVSPCYFIVAVVSTSVLIVSFDGRQINRLFRRVSVLCAFCLWIILQSKF